MPKIPDKLAHNNMKLIWYFQKRINFLKKIFIIIGKVARIDGINDQPKNSFISSMFLKIYKYVKAKLIVENINNLAKKVYFELVIIHQSDNNF